MIKITDSRGVRAEILSPRRADLDHVVQRGGTLSLYRLTDVRWVLLRTFESHPARRVLTGRQAGRFGIHDVGGLGNRVRNVLVQVINN